MASLRPELSQSHAQHHKVQAEGRSLRDELAVALAAGQHAEALGSRLAERELQIEELLRGQKVIEAMAAEKEDRRQTLEIELASARVSLSLQEKVIADMNTQLLHHGSRRNRSALQAYSTESDAKVPTSDMP